MQKKEREEYEKKEIYSSEWQKPKMQILSKEVMMVMKYSSKLIQVDYVNYAE